LTVDGKTLTAGLSVKMDPRVKVPANALEAKFKAEAHLASILDESSRAIVQGGSIREQLEKVNAPPNSPSADAVQAFQKKMTALLGAAGGFFAPPSQEVTLSRVNGQAGALYQQVWQADAAPTSSQAEAVTAVARDSVDVLQRWSAFTNSDLATLNRLLRDSNIPEVHVESDPRHEEQQVDEE